MSDSCETRTLEWSEEAKNADPLTFDPAVIDEMPDDAPTISDITKAWDSGFTFDTDATALTPLLISEDPDDAAAFAEYVMILTDAEHDLLHAGFIPVRLHNYCTRA